MRSPIDGDPNWWATISSVILTQLYFKFMSFPTTGGIFVGSCTKKMFVFILPILLFIPKTWSAVSQETLSIGTIAEFDTLNPIIVTQAAAKYMLYLSWRPSVGLDLKNKWVPIVLKQFPTLENKLVQKKGKGLIINFEILPQAVWGDGTPMTCKDLDLSRKIQLHPNVSIANKEPFENISSFTWDDKNPKKCRMETKIAKYDYYGSIPDPIPSHLEGPVFEKYNGEREGYDRNTLYVKTPNNPGLYFGPYVISQVQLGSHVVFTQNPRWYGKKPFFKKVIFKLIGNNNTMEANLRSGVIDLISPPGGLGVDQANELDEKIKREKLPFEVQFRDGNVYSHIDLNMDNPILSDIRVRKALAMGINKKEMVKNLLANRAKIAVSNVPENDPWFTKKVTTYEYNKKAAASLLDEAGWKIGSTGIREKNGKKLSLTIMAVAGAKTTDAIQAYMQNQWKQLGIEVLIKNEPARVFFGETTTKRKFDMALYAWVSIPESSPRSTMHSSMISSEKNSWSGQNYHGLSNKELDENIDKLEQELNFNKRKAYAQKVMEIYNREIPVIPLYFRQSNAVYPSNLKGYEISPNYFYETLYIENWILQ